MLDLTAMASAGPVVELPTTPSNRMWGRHMEILDATGADVLAIKNAPQRLKSPQFDVCVGEVRCRECEKE